MTWARRYPAMKRTATGTGRTQPPWHLIVSPPSHSFPRTACGKNLRGVAERTGSRPDDGPACRACSAAEGVN